MLVQLVPLNDDGTRDEKWGTVTIPAGRLQGVEQLRDVEFPAATDQEREAERLQLFREAQRLFAADPTLLTRMQSLLKALSNERPAYEPKPQARRELHPILDELHGTLFPQGQPFPTVLSIAVAPQDQALSFFNGVDWTILHLDADATMPVYNNGQPFGSPVVEIWREEGTEPWDDSEHFIPWSDDKEDHERP
jgi:hypothetical protein